MPYRLRRATLADTGEIWSLLKETVAWLQSLGTDQWSNWTTWGGQNGKVTRAIAAGSVWLLYDRRRLIATVTVEPYGDPDVWTADERAERALYVSKLAVRRSHASLGIGALCWSGPATWPTGQKLAGYALMPGAPILSCAATTSPRVGTSFGKSTIPGESRARSSNCQPHPYPWPTPGSCDQSTT